MGSSERVRIEVGFEGGQIMGAIVSGESADELERVLADGRGSADSLLLDADDGRYLVILPRVVYVKRFAREGRVGFGA